MSRSFFCKMNLFELDGFAGLVFPSFSPIPCDPALNWQIILQPQGSLFPFVYSVEFYSI